MPLPKKVGILNLARSRSIERDVRAGLPSITPEESELKETGAFQEAQEDLMRTGSGAYAEQERYLSNMAGEMGLKIIPIRELATLKKEHGIEYTNGWSHTKPRQTFRPAVKTTIVHPRKVSVPSRVTQAIMSPLTVLIGGSHRRKRRMGKINHNRTSKTMRSLRHVKGVKVFSFPDSVWKVKRKNRRKRRSR